MCLATPFKIKKIHNNKAILNINRQIDLALISDAKAGDWLLCHANLAINKISEEEAQEILKLTKSCPH